MRLLVTGATGFIGGHLVRRLVDDGHDVAVLVRLTSDTSRLRALRPAIEISFDRGDGADLPAILAGVKPDAVVHLASLFLAQHRPEDVPALIETNVALPARLLEAMRETGVRRLVNTGTAWQAPTSLDYDPVNLYASTKQAFEDILAYYVSAHDFVAVTLRLSDTYGPGDQRPKLISLLRRTARQGTVLAMSPGEQIIDLTHVDDVVEAFCVALARLDRAPGAEVHRVGGGDRMRLRDLVALYSEVTGRPLRVDWGALPYRPREVMVPSTSLPLLPGWRPHTALRDGLRELETQVAEPGHPS